MVSSDPIQNLTDDPLALSQSLVTMLNNDNAANNPTPVAPPGFVSEPNATNSGLTWNTATKQYETSINGGLDSNGAWDPGAGSNALAPTASAYNPQNAQSIFNQLGQNANLGLVNNGGATSNTNLGNTSNMNAAGISPLMMLNGGANVGTATQAQNAAASQQAINNLNNIAQGHGPSAATIAAQQQAQQNTASQMAAIASAGGNPALAQRNAANAAATANQQAAQNAVLGSAQEQLGAQGTLQSALNAQTLSGQAIPLAQAQLNQQAALANQGVQATGATTQAQMIQQANAANQAAQNTTNLQQGTMNQQTNLANQQALLSSTALNANQQNQSVNAEMQQSSYDTAQAENYQTEYQNAQEQLYGANKGVAIAGNALNAQTTGATLGAIGTVAAGIVSDRRSKTNIVSGTRDINKFLASLNVKMPQRFSFAGGK